MSYGAGCAQRRYTNYACEGVRVGEAGGGREGAWGGRGPASNLQGLVSNTIWKETIQKAGGVREEGGEGKRRGDKGREVNTSKVTCSR